jgi:hypothetical protein
VKAFLDRRVKHGTVSDRRRRPLEDRAVRAAAERPRERNCRERCCRYGDRYEPHDETTLSPRDGVGDDHAPAVGLRARRRELVERASDSDV